MRATLLHVAAFACFFVGLFFVSQAYTMAFHGVYLDCFGGGCAPRTFGEPTLPSALYGTLLALAALLTFYFGRLALKAGRRSAS
ncbi:MAG TPA: hypothetical protein VEB41_13920 [Burkholderiales bacterium]|nr:hypothetical protein [Burkholderiales bacterium]